jgi:hypothetical protein
VSEPRGDAIDFPELVARLDEIGDWRDDDVILAQCAELLGRAAAHPQVLSAIVRRLLSDVAGTQAGNVHVSSTLMVKSTAAYIIRMNLWFPENMLVPHADNLFGYNVFHDHNFSFVTAGIAGNGYFTTNSAYDGRFTEIGDRIDWAPRTTTQLKPGMVTTYRSGIEIHAQSRPPELSVSLNVLPRRPVVRPQMFVDADGVVVDVRGPKNRSGAVTLCRLAGALRHPALARSLEDVADHTSDERLKRAAHAALQQAST